MRILMIMVATATLTACAGGSKPDKLDFSRKGSNVSGIAGSNWSNEDLELNRFRAVCRGEGEKIGTISISPRNENGEADFSATCVK